MLTLLHTLVQACLFLSLVQPSPRNKQNTKRQPIPFRRLAEGAQLHRRQLPR